MSGESVKRGVIAVLISLFVIFTVIAISIISASKVTAFGISTPYIDNNTLKLMPGQNYTYILTVQNNDDEGYYIDIKYASTNSIAKLVTEEQYIDAKTYDNKFEFLIIIPKDAKLGDKYVLEYSTKPRTENITITNAAEIKRSVDIVVADENVIDTSLLSQDKKSFAAKSEKYALGIIIVVLLIIILMKLWKLSLNISKRFAHKAKTSYTINQASNLSDVKALLQKLSDDEYNIPEIKNMFKSKLSELIGSKIAGDISQKSRQEVINTLGHMIQK